MTRSNDAETPVRGNSSQSAGKRRLEEPEADSPSRSRKQRRSIAELPSSSQCRATVLESPRKSGNRTQRGKKRKISDSPSPAPTGTGFSNMYHFEPSRPKPGIVDLISSPPSGSARPRNTSFSAQPRKPTFNPHSGPKKLVVKNLRTTPRVDPQQYFERVWKQQDSALAASFNDDKIPYSLEELYKGAENVCRQGKAPELYTRLRQKCKEHLEGQITENLKETASKSETDVAVLKAFVEAWAKWQRQLLTIRQIFYYMDQTYLLRSTENPSLTETGLILFRNNVFADHMLKQKVMSGVVELIDTDRRGEISENDSDLLRRSIDTLHELTIYTSDFEPVFKKSSDKYFRTWRETEAEKFDLAHYASSSTDLVSKEMTRCDMLTLDRSTRADISELFDTIFVEEKIEFLSEEDAVLDLLEDQKYTELRQVFTLLQRKGQGEKLGPTFDKFIIQEGSLIVFDEKEESDMVLKLLDFKKSLDHFHKFSFHNNDNVGNGYHKSFEHFINLTKKTDANWGTDNAKPGEMIAKHVDLLLKGGVKAIPKLANAKADPSKPAEEHDFDDAPADEDAEINRHLSDALDLFRFVQGKAVFEAFYKKDLARRLLMGRSASHDAERNMLTRLKNECGASFTHNLESMFKDMDLAREEMASYNQLLDDRGRKSGAGPDLHVNVLSAASWPTYPDVPVNIPTAISKLMSDFEIHYKTKHNGRMLTWKNALAHCQLKSKFPKGNKEIVVSGFQAIVLLLFNDIPADGSLSYIEIQEASGLSDAELKRTLQSLACAKYRVLTKAPKGRDVNNTDTFTFNAGFTDPKMRIKINQVQLKETKEENKETHQRVAQDRVFETQAAIVRIMKSKKTITHTDLIIDVINATKTRGVLDQIEIKKNIEKLIEKDYMERIDGTNKYSYVA